MPTGGIELKKSLTEKRRWLVTGAAGFIGSHLVQNLLQHGQEVVGIDNFVTGIEVNLQDVERTVGANFRNFNLLRGSITDPAICREGVKGCQVVLHQAALGSVSRSIADPMPTHDANVTGFLQMLLAARDAGVSRFVFASSSSVYGDSPMLPKREENLGNVLSPYAASKRFNEIYAAVAQELYGLETVALRYFNVFGPRQDPEGEYAAVIPRWIKARLRRESCFIFGDGETSRDFCYIDNVVQANLLAAVAPKSASGQPYNIAFGERTTLRELYALIDECVSEASERRSPEFKDFRPGDVRHSLADISQARSALGYEPQVSLRAGLAKTVEWYKGL